ncbi:aminopeptidase N [Catenovulum agarivorans DS-2]|uniref:Aminopeptidase N n=2 Tax=Catenovulum agarivorans TaxID=1172192 RepID=W7QAX0_9ALTE|nr:aminopeptidase N [Catenovulum agarivorans DS-2]
MQAKYLKDYQAPDYLVDTIELTVELLAEKTLVESKVHYKKANPTATCLILNGEQQKVLSVLLDGRALAASDYLLTDEAMQLDNLPDSFELTIKTEIDPVNNTSLEGLYLSAGAYCTQCEAEGFRKITYYQDRPDVLAVFTTHIIADQSEFPYLLSNGNKVAEQQLSDGRTQVTWQDPFPKPCYLFALVAGDFDCLADTYTTKSGREVKLELFVDKGNLKRAAHAMSSLKTSMQWDEQRFGLEYDLDVYMIVAVDFFNMGAMENKGLNVFNSKCVLADQDSATDADYLSIESIVGHEYFHNWTGNRVTCRDWFQLSLKEGLTVFRDQEFSMDLGSRAVNRIHQVKVMREHQFAEDAGPMSHPIRPESVIEMNNFYTVTVYDKGAEVIRMMHSIVGEQGFQAGMKLYFQRHDGQAVTCDDFVAAMQDANNADLSLFKRWYSQSGTPEVKADIRYSNGTLSVTLAQHTPSTADQQEKLPLHIPVNVAFFDAQGQLLTDIAGGAEQVLHLTQAQQTFEFAVASQPYVSLLRDFSAPVKLSYNYSDEALSCLIPAETSQYTKWELMQALYNKHLLAKITNQNYQFPTVIGDTIKALMADDQTDKALLAEILSVPSVNSLLEIASGATIDAVIDAQKALKNMLASTLQAELQSCYQQNHIGKYQYSQNAIAQRSLANACLGLLAVNAKSTKNITLVELVNQQYQTADNMTDKLAAMSAASIIGGELFAGIIQHFDQQWRGDALVMDKWFAVQARQDVDDILDKIEQLQSHPDFNWNNPNRVRALIGQFAMFNPVQFHHSSGRGYRFLAQVIQKMNAINPQVAARMITPLIQFSKLDDARIQIIREELAKLAELPKLSKDLFEKISKALQQ